MVQLAKILSTFYGIQKFMTVHKNPQLNSILSQMYPVHLLTTIYWRTILIVSMLSLPTGLSTSGLPTRILPAFLIYTMSYSSHLSCFGHHNNIWKMGQIMKFFIMQVLPVSYNYLYLSLNIILSTLHVCASLKAKDQTSCPYKMSGKDLDLYILPFTFQERKEENKGFWSEW